MLLWAAVLVGAVVLLYWTKNSWGGFDWDRFMATLRNVDLRWLIGAAVLNLLTYPGRAWRWAVMIQPLKARVSFWKVLEATVIGFTAVVLFGRPGELVRPYLVARYAGLSVSSQAAVWLLERIYDLLVVLCLFGYALAQFSAHAGGSAAWRQLLQTGGWMAAALGAICLAILVAFSRYGPATQRRLEEALGFLPGHLGRRMEQVVQAFSGGMRAGGQRAVIARILVLSLAEWALIVSGIWALLRAVPATSWMTFHDAGLVCGVVAFGSVVQIPGLGGGLQLATILVLTQAYGLSLEEAAGAALLLWAVSFPLVAPIGVVWAFHTGIRWRTLRSSALQQDRSTSS